LAHRKIDLSRFLVNAELWNAESKMWNPKNVEMFADWWVKCGMRNRDCNRRSETICDLLHQNESHVANIDFELADDKRHWGVIYHF